MTLQKWNRSTYSRTLGGITRAILGISVRHTHPIMIPLASLLQKGLDRSDIRKRRSKRDQEDPTPGHLPPHTFSSGNICWPDNVCPHVGKNSINPIRQIDHSPLETWLVLETGGRGWFGTCSRLQNGWNMEQKFLWQIWNLGLGIIALSHPD